MTQGQRPLPAVTELNRPFWEGAAAGELRLQRCAACAHLLYPIASLCPVCLGRELRWETLSGRATVHASVVFHQVYNPAFATEVPYNVSIVQLAEGPLMMTNVVGVEPSRVEVGQELRFAPAEIAEGVFLPRFEPQP